MKIGIMGGTFDPIHNGHLMLGEYAYKMFGLDEIWFMPNGNPPHKDSTIESDTEKRTDMVREAIKNVPCFKLSLHEVKQDKVCYSCDTLKELKEIYPEHEFFFIIGADSLFTIESWYHPGELISACTILAAFRGGKDREEMDRQIAYLNRKYHARIILLAAPVFDVSSREIRKRVKERKSLSGLVPEPVEAYIRKYSLYEEKKK